MEKLLWMLEDLQGKKVWLNPEGELEIGLIDERVAKIVNPATSKVVRRLAPLEAVKAHVMSLKREHEPRKGVPAGLRALAVGLLDRTTEYRKACEEEKKSIAREKARLAKNKEKLDRHVAQESMLEIGGGNLLHKDTHTPSTLLAKIDASKRRLATLQEKHDATIAQSSHFLKSRKEVLIFLEEHFGLSVALRTLTSWRGNIVGVRAKGRQSLVTPEVEKAFVDSLLYADKLGYPLFQKQAREALESLIQQENPRLNRSTNAQERWFKRWVKKAKDKYPELTLIRGKVSDDRLLSWFNTENVNYWFDQFIHVIIEDGFARRADPEKGEVGEAVWLDPSRVLITDETCVSGASPGKSGSAAKVLCSTKNVDAGCRRIAPKLSEFDRHITLLAGHTCKGDTAVPIWFMPGEGGMRKESIEKLHKVAPTSRTLGCFNGREYNDVIYDVSPKGGATRENLKDVFLRAVQIMYPDVANENGKRVLWLTDWHDSRITFDMLDSLRSKGITWFGWLPNATCKMQAPDVGLFGPMKSTMQALTRSWPSYKVLDRFGKVDIAGKALAKVFTRSNILQALEKTGMNPIDRTPLLTDPALRDGDLARERALARLGTATLAVIQDVPENYVPGTPDSGRLTPDSTSPERRKLVEKTLKEFSATKRPRIGPNRALSEIKTKDDEFKRGLDVVLEKLEKRLDGAEEQHKRRASTLQNACRIEEAAYKQEKASVKHWMREVKRIRSSSSSAPSEVARDSRLTGLISELVDDLHSAARDPLGLALDDDEPLDMEMPAFEELTPSNKRFLMSFCDSFSEAVTNRGKRRRVNNFKPGHIIHETGKFSPTCPEVINLVREYEQTKAQADEEKTQKREAKKEARERRIAELPALLRVVRDKITSSLDSGRKITVKDCKEFLRLTKELARVNCDTETENLVQQVQNSGHKREQLTQTVLDTFNFNHSNSHLDSE